MRDLLWLIPLLPFLGALLNGVVLWRRASKKAVAWIACGSVLASMLLGMVAIGQYMGSTEYEAGEPFVNSVYEWVPAGGLTTAAGEPVDLSIEMGFHLDTLSAVMVFVVTFVGFFIHVYSIGYMAHEEGFQRYFTYLNLFMGAMLTLVLGSNFLVLFVGWEGVGLCSYLLIGYYYQEDFPPFAGRKAFLVNRVGDFAFLLGMFALVHVFGSLKFTEINAALEADTAIATAPYFLGLTVAGFITLMLFVGATGKSAQIPLYVWLPDAMAGPTPVSALIHAATMVTAGVYMVARTNGLYQIAGGISDLVAVVGCATAIFAGTIAIAQNDIKKVLAYSTVSQLGYMFLAAGLGAYGVAIFHLGTHAFFKALLFLGSGSVIHAMGGEQDMRKMGGLKDHLPTTYRTFLIGALAIAGVPFLAGFFSKDAILAAAFEGHHEVLWAVGLITAGLTAFYMFRAVFMTFHGEFRGSEEQHHHLHESPPVMTVPLMVLAVGAVLAGYLGKIPFFHQADWLGKFLQRSVLHLEGFGVHHAPPGALLELFLVGASIAVAGCGILIAWRLYGRGRGVAADEAFEERAAGVHRVLSNKYYVDELYDATVVKGTWASAAGLFKFDAGVIDGLLVMGSRHVTVAVSLLSGFFDKYFVDGLVNFTGWILDRFSRLFRRLQTGLVSQYAFVLAAGTLAMVVLYLLFLRGQ